MLDSKKWYENSRLFLHLDEHVDLDKPSLGSGITLKKAREIIQRIKPDAVQIHSKGHPGYATYPTKVGTPHPNLQKDILGLWRQAASAEGIRFSVYYSAGIDNIAADNHQEWVKRKADGSLWVLGSQFMIMCSNSNYVTDLYYPMLAEIIEQYSPDGFWMDSEIGAAVSCYCDKCVELFKTKFGIEPPRSAKEAGITEWAEFGRDIFRSHLRRTADFIHGLSPDCMFSSSSVFSEVMPEPVIEGVDYLTGDVEPAKACIKSDFRSRTYKKLDKPFDVMLFMNGFAWNDRPMQPKPVVQLCQEAMSAAVHGANISLWICPNPDSSILEIDIQRASEVNQFVRKMPLSLDKLEAYTEINILNSRSFAYQRQDGFQNDGLFAVNHWAEEIQGAHRMLLDAHYQFDIVHEQHLLEGFSENIKVVIVPAQGNLSLDIINSLECFIRKGGTVIASGSSFTVGENAKETQSLFGVCFGELVVDPVGLNSQVGTFPVPGQWWEMELDHMSNAQEQVELDYFKRQGRAGIALATRQLENGKAVSISGSIFLAYHEERHPMLRHWFKQQISQSFSDPLIIIENCPGISCVVSENENDRAIHLIDRTSAESAEVSYWFVEQPGHTGPVSVDLLSLRDPISVKLLSSGEDVGYVRKDKRIKITIPHMYIYEAIQVKY